MTRNLIRTLVVAAVPLTISVAWADGTPPGVAFYLVEATSLIIATYLVLVRPNVRRISVLEREGRELATSNARTVADLKHERDLLGGVLETMQDGVLLLDEHDQIVLVNPSLRSSLLLAAGVVGKPLRQAIDRSDLTELVEQARSSAASVDCEIAIGGLKPRILAVQANPMRAPAGAVLLVFFDFTEIRRLESMRRDFVANVSHELRTPVTAICSAAETLLAGALKDPGAASMFVEIIERNSHRMQRLVEDLLDLSRIESGDYKLERAELDVAPIVEHSLSLLKEKAKQGRVRTDVAIAAGLPRVRADPRALEQVLVNLVDNSIKYCPPGSRVVVRVERDGERRVRIAIEDTGPGIHEHDLPRIFERFYRVDAGRSRDMGGTGLGLSIVKHLVEAMGGNVGVDSRIGFGSRFWFTMPQADAELAYPQRAPIDINVDSERQG